MKIYAYIALSILAIGLAYEGYQYIRLRKEAEKVRVCASITYDGTQHYRLRETLFVRSKADGSYALYNRVHQLKTDQIREWSIRSIGINEKDTFELIEYVNMAGDTLLYDAYTAKSIRPEEFEPHIKEAMFWEFNYSNL